MIRTEGEYREIFNGEMKPKKKGDYGSRTNWNRNNCYKNALFLVAKQYEHQ